MNGVALKQDFNIIKNNPLAPQTTGVVASAFDEVCCFDITFLAETGTPTSDLKNDKTSFIWFLDNNFVSAEMTLQKYVNGAWVNKTALIDATYGTFYAYGYGGKTIYDEDRIGYLLDFNKVFNASTYGEGKYRVKCTGTTILDTTIDYFSFEFCLSKYFDHVADNTVRLEWYKNGNDGRILDISLKNDFDSLNWYNSIRLPNSYFGLEKQTKDKTFVKYQNGNEVWLSDNIEIEYTLKVMAVEFWLINLISFDFNTNSEMYITDYNSTNQTVFIKQPISSISGANITYTDGSNLVSAEYTYKPLINNFVHKRG
jgi:hypothetical protein